MNVEIGTEVMQFPKKEYINGICVAVYARIRSSTRSNGSQINTQFLILFYSLSVEHIINVLKTWNAA
jgi:hypothetical protein